MKFKVTLDVETSAVIGEGDSVSWNADRLRRMFEQPFTSPAYVMRLVPIYNDTTVKVASVEAIEK